MTLHAVNPNHPVTQMLMAGDMEIPTKLLAILTWKAGGKLEVTHQDLHDFMAQPMNVFIAHFHEHSIELKVVTVEEGEQIAAAAGGLPL